MDVVVMDSNFSDLLCVNGIRCLLNMRKHETYFEAITSVVSACLYFYLNNALK